MVIYSASVPTSVECWGVRAKHLIVIANIQMGLVYFNKNVRLIISLHLKAMGTLNPVSD